ncbi:MAG: tetratricopeptide repeat protein [Armatimonadota bacterium]
MYCLHCDSEIAVEKDTCPICSMSFITDSDYYFRQGMDAMLIGNFDRAIKLLQTCVDLHPAHISGQYNLGEAFASARRCDEAMAHYVIAAQENPDIPGIYTALGKAAFGSYIAHSQEAESMSNSMICLLKKAIVHDPQDVGAHISLGEAYLAIGDTEKAIKCLCRCLEIEPASPSVYLELAKVYVSLEQFTEAEDMASKSMQHADPDDPVIDDIKELLCELQLAKS